MSPREAWRVLGIDPVDDPRAVRTAYSARLKALDVDADPAGFIQLRTAFEAATRIARQAADRAARQASGDPEEEEDEDDYDEEEWDEEEAEDDSPRIVTRPGRAFSRPSPASEPAPPPRTSPWASVPDRYAAARREIEQELRSSRMPVDTDRLKNALSVLLNRDSLARVDHAAFMDGWLLETILAHIPRSDVLIEPGLYAFRWHQADGISPEIERLLDRWRDIHFRDTRLARRRAWRRLQGPFTPPGRLQAHGKWVGIQNLLDEIERDHPTLFQDCDPDALSWWQNYLHRPRIRVRDRMGIIAAGAVAATALVPPFVAALPDTEGGIWRGILAGALASVLGMAVAALFALWRVRIERRIHDDPGRWDDPPFRPHEAAAALALLALPLAAVAAPPGWWASIGLGLLAGLLLIAIGRRYDWDRYDRELRKRRGFGAAMAVVAWAFCGLPFSLAAYRAGMLPIACAGVAGFLLQPRMREWLDGHRLLDRWGAPLLTLALSALVTAAIQNGFGPIGLLYGCAAAPLLLLVQHLLLPARRRTWEIIAVWLGAIVAMFATPAHEGGVLLSLAFAAGNAICSIAAARAILALVRR